MMWLGSGIGALSSVIGMYLSDYLDAPPGATIVLVAFSFFMLAFLLRGVLRTEVPAWKEKRDSRVLH